MSRAPYSNDPRGEITRRSLVHAYAALLAETGTATPGEVSARAGLNRSSFYAHFTSLEDLAAHAFRTELADIHRENLMRQLEGGMSGPESNGRTIRDIVATAAAPEGLTLVLLQADRAFGERAIGAILRDYIDEYFGSVAAFDAVPVSRRSAVSEYVGHALAGLIVAWLLRELPIERSELESRIVAMTPTWVLDPDEVARTP